MASGSSPPEQARLGESKGAPLTPPCRSVKASSTGPEVRRSAYNSSVVQPAWLLQEVGDVEVVVVELERRPLSRRLRVPGPGGDALAIRRVVGCRRLAPRGRERLCSLAGLLLGRLHRSAAQSRLVLS